jgi:pimeloyl-ACP methyl ester carboxylesterase
MTAPGAPEVARHGSITYARRPGAPPPLLLLHGWGTDSSFMWPVTDQLPGRHAICPDLPGHGASPNPPAPWGVPEYAAAVADLARQDAGGGPFDVVAHSFGARIGLRLAASGEVPLRRLLLTGAAGLRAPGASAKPRASVRMARFAARHGGTAGEALRERVYERVGSEDYRQAVRDGLRETFVKVVNDDLRDLLGEIRVPVLLVFGDRDDATPIERGREMADAIPDAALVTFEGRGHYAYLDELPRFGAIAREFLAT